MKPIAFLDLPVDAEMLEDYLVDDFFQRGEELSRRNEKAHLARSSASGEIDLAELEALEAATTIMTRKTKKYFPVRCNACGWPGPKPQNIAAGSAAQALLLARRIHNRHWETYYAPHLCCRRAKAGIVIAHFNSLFN